jgi:hypothetical protein
LDIEIQEATTGWTHDYDGGNKECTQGFGGETCKLTACPMADLCITSVEPFGSFAILLVFLSSSYRIHFWLL